MKIIEALKQVKRNRQKIEELTMLISSMSAYMESQSEDFKGSNKKIEEYAQSVRDTIMNNEKLLTLIQKTNLETKVKIEMPNGVIVNKTISQWITRRREGIDQEIAMYKSLTDNRLKTTTIKSKDDEVMIDKLVRNFDKDTRDKKLMHLSDEKSIIDSHLEIVNAITDLME